MNCERGQQLIGERVIALAGDVRALEAELEAMLAAAGAGDTHRLLVHDVRFHELIVEASGNGTLRQVSRSLPHRGLLF